MLSLWYENFPPGKWFRVSLESGVGFGKGGEGLELGGVRDIIQHVMIEVMPQLWHDIVTNSDE